MKRAICLPPPPPFPRTCFNTTRRQIQAPCSQTRPTPRPALLMVHVFSITALDLKAAKDVHCTWPPSTSMNHPLTGNHQSVGSYRSRLIGRCAKTMWKLPQFADGHEPTGATMAPKWLGVARKEPRHMLADLQLSRAWAMSYQRLSALKSSCS